MDQYRYLMGCDTDTLDGYIDSGKWQKLENGSWKDQSGASPLIEVGDTVQYALETTGDNAVEKVQLTVAISGRRGVSSGHRPSRGTPFKSSGSLICLLSDDATPANGLWQTGPYDVNGLDSSGPGQPRRQKFEFLAVAKVEFADGSSAQFSYDPEMDVRGRP